MRKLIVGGIGLALMSSSALAADVAPKMAVYAPTPVAYNWTGFYAGLNAGGAFGDVATVDVNGGVPPGPFAYQPKGVLAGGQAGFNYQVFGPVVVGVEVDFGYLGLTSGKGFIPSSNPAFHQDLTVGGGAYADVAGRIGVAFNNLLIYGKAGYGYVDVSAKQTTTKPGYKTTGTEAFSGTVYGAGVEYAFAQNWTAKIEYLRFDLGDQAGKQTSVTDPPIGFQYANSTSLKIDTVKLGVNYRF